MQVHHVEDGKCLVSHSPNPQQCAMQGNSVWDDTGFAAAESFGGSCISADTAHRIQLVRRESVEMVTIEVSHDPNSFGHPSLVGATLKLKCLRGADRGAWRQQYVYGRVCAARLDYGSLPADLPPHAWDSYVPKEDRKMEL